MSVRATFAAIISFTFLGGGISASVGYGLGRLCPAYYRSVVQVSEETGFDEASLGLRLGLTQGMAAGFVIALAFVALVSWRKTRLNWGTVEQPAHDGESAKSWRVTWRFVLVVGFLFTICICLIAAFFVGMFAESSRADHRRYLEERDILAPVLASDPAFADVEIVERSDGGAFLFGELPTPADEKRLRALVARVVGEARAKDAMYGIGTR